MIKRFRTDKVTGKPVMNNCQVYTEGRFRPPNSKYVSASFRSTPGESSLCNKSLSSKKSASSTSTKRNLNISKNGTKPLGRMPLVKTNKSISSSRSLKSTNRFNNLKNINPQKKNGSRVKITGQSQMNNQNRIHKKQVHEEVYDRVIPNVVSKKELKYSFKNYNDGHTGKQTINTHFLNTEPLKRNQKYMSSPQKANQKMTPLMESKNPIKLFSSKASSHTLSNELDRGYRTSMEKKRARIGRPMF